MNGETHRIPTVAAIYGLLTVLPVLVVMRDHPPSGWLAAGVALGTTLAVALAETYAETVGALLHRPHRLTSAELKANWRAGIPILAGA